MTFSLSWNDLFSSFNLHANSQLYLTEFLNSVGQLKYRGTSVLFRLNGYVADSIRPCQSVSNHSFDQSMFIERILDDTTQIRRWLANRIEVNEKDPQECAARFLTRSSQRQGQLWISRSLRDPEEIRSTEPSRIVACDEIQSTTEYYHWSSSETFTSIYLGRNLRSSEWHRTRVDAEKDPSPLSRER